MSLNQIHDILRFDVHCAIQRLEHHRACEAVHILCRRGNYFDGNESPAARLPSTTYASTIFIQRPYGQASLLAKCYPHQSARFILRNQCLHFGPATPPLYRSRFTHGSSATLNAEHEQNALLRRIPLSSPPVSQTCGHTNWKRAFQATVGEHRQTHEGPDAWQVSPVLPKSGYETR